MGYYLRTVRIFEEDGHADVWTSGLHEGDARTEHDNLAKRWRRMGPTVRQLRSENMLARTVTNNPTIGVYVEVVTHLEEITQPCEECGAPAGQSCEWSCTGQPTVQLLPDDVYGM